MTVRYQIFVSSTFADLENERGAVVRALMQMDCIPAGMELFPAIDEEQFNFIKRIIDDCDYYIVIIGGRYGSVDASGVSYTEKEYDYAIEKGLKVLAFVHDNPNEIEIGKSELDPIARERLSNFRKKVMEGRLVRKWKSADQLAGLVALSLPQTIKTYPAVGWTRADKVTNEDALNQINILRTDSAQKDAALTELKKKVRALEAAPRPLVENLAGLDEEIDVGGKHTWQNSTSSWSVRVSWRTIFFYISPFLIEHPSDRVVNQMLAEALFPLSGRVGRSPRIFEQHLATIRVQLIALKLIQAEYTKATDGSMALFWSLTSSGQAKMIELRTVKSNAQAPSK